MYSILGEEDQIIHANLHSVRGVATMWSEFARMPPPKEIFRATTWSTSCSFACHYSLDIDAKNPPNFATQLLTMATKGQPQ